MTTSATTHAWLCLRLSREKAGSDDSLENPELILRDRAAGEGLAVTKVFSEGAGKSAYSGKTRPEWQRLLDELEAHVVVMAVETRRFSRNEADGFVQLAAIEDVGAFILTTRDGADSRREGDELPQGIRLVVAAHESREKAKAQSSAGTAYEYNDNHLTHLGEPSSFCTPAIRGGLFVVGVAVPQTLWPKALATVGNGWSDLPTCLNPILVLRTCSVRRPS